MESKGEINKWTRIPDKAKIDRAMSALKENGINVHFAVNEQEAIKKFFEILPQGAEVMTMTSMTLEALGIPKEINESGKYNSIRKQFSTMDKQTQAKQMQQMGAAPDFAVGSVHAVTEDGKIVIVSAFSND